MRARLVVLGLAGVLLSSSFASAYEPTDDDIEAAQKHMRSAYAWVKAHKYGPAAREYRKALDRLPGDMDLLYNLVAVSKANGSCEAVIRYGTAFAGVAARSKEMGEIRRDMDRCEKELGGQVGRLEVTGAPIRADVWVDGLFMGKAPLKPLVLPAGQVSVRVSAEDYDDWSGTASVSADGDSEVAAAPVARIYTGYLQVTTTPAEGVSVYVDDKLVGVTPLGPIALSTGRVLVRFELPGWDRWVRYVTIQKEATEDLEATLERTDEKSTAQATATPAP